MPIYSMTGFARAQVNLNDALTYTLSVKTVNHRFLDVQMRLPNGLDALENDLRKALKDSLVRGHVDLTLNVDRNAQSRAGYNRELISSYVAAFAAARRSSLLSPNPITPRPASFSPSASFKCQAIASPSRSGSGAR